MQTFFQKIIGLGKSIPTSVQESYANKLFPKLFSGWALLTFLVSFNDYLGSGYLSTKSSLPCFPHFQGCKNFFDYINLIPLPYGYGESIFFTVLLGLLVLGAYYLYEKKFFRLHLILWSLFLVKSFILLTNYGLGNYDYYDTAVIFVFLLYPSRHDLVKLVFVILYFLASTIKIHEGWILGTYFSSLYYGLPLIPDNLIPLATNIIILTQMVGCWFLLSSNKKLSSYALYFFIFFHLYSTILVGYRYPITSLLSLLVIFFAGKKDHYIQNFSLKKNTLIFYLFIVILFIGQSISYLIPGDQKLTLEGNNYGLYMFEANHQCISYVTVQSGRQSVAASYDARNRCDPYMYMKNLQRNYCTTPVEKVSWIFDHSINGGPFRRIVDESDVCSLIYKPFARNTWIQDEQQAITVGKTYKNVYIKGSDNTVIRNGEYIYAQGLSNSAPNQSSAFQLTLEKFSPQIKFFYWLIWTGTLLLMLYKLVRQSLL